MAKYNIKNLKFTPQEGVKAFSLLKQEVTALGILDRTPGYYTFLISACFLGFIGSWVFLFIFRQHLIPFIFISPVLAFFTIQLGGIMHDAGHQAIGSTPKTNDFWGNLSALTTGLFLDEWKLKHNLHHAKPNHTEEDPDLQIPILSYSVESAQRKNGLSRSLVRYQHLLYYILGTFATTAMRVSSFIFLLDKSISKKWWQTLAFILSIFMWYVLPFFIFTPINATIFIVITSALIGLYQQKIFAPNHKGMPEISKGDKLSFVEEQIVTSRNVTSNPFVDFFYLGLNYQIEHHLFPNCPRPNLPRLSQVVKNFCKKYDLDYTSVSPLKTDLIILRELKQVAKNYNK